MLTSKISKALVLALTASTLVVTGCASQKPKSQVVVAPLGGHGANTGYTGGALVNNSADIQNAARNMQGVVHFDFDSDAIRPDAAAILDQQAQFLNANQGARVQIAGHTDERGSREYNMSLGERRAAAVRGYLASKGVNTANVEILSFGEEQPVATGSNEAAWAQNRRAELSY
ncbi:peptidoglycan-associated lipoprotein Pal [Moraxella sp. K127]|uniref:peptidoglycan-associated lipoprotein Pal n=1 Tax=Moraxella sp. K127 TaxID=2780079 RepID=UPI00187E1230|nr:peptidoglycan-associated lipoprotein Pal [Moraxella sp. K127]MBE9590962.1 peptidoglycan-associated lipoprotein Pal [Moraxella sp. K127]